MRAAAMTSANSHSERAAMGRSARVLGCDLGERRLCSGDEAPENASATSLHGPLTADPTLSRGCAVATVEGQDAPGAMQPSTSVEPIISRWAVSPRPHVGAARSGRLMDAGRPPKVTTASSVPCPSTAERGSGRSVDRPMRLSRRRLGAERGAGSAAEADQTLFGPARELAQVRHRESPLWRGSARSRLPTRRALRPDGAAGKFVTNFGDADPAWPEQTFGLAGGYAVGCWAGSSREAFKDDRPVG
jgi:hypothetical protein